LLQKIRAARRGDVSAALEIESAGALRSAGLNVHFVKEAGGIPGGVGRTADLLVGGFKGTGIGGAPYEVFSPETANPGAIARALRRKLGQSSRFVLNLTRSNVEIGSLGNLIARANGVPGSSRRVNEVIFVRNGVILEVQKWRP
jgi:hypothetical protein